MDLLLENLTARDVHGLCQLTIEDIREGGAGGDLADGESALLPYLEETWKGISGLGSTMRKLVEGCRKQRAAAQTDGAQAERGHNPI